MDADYPNTGVNLACRFTLVANPIPLDAIPISNELPRYRLQVEDLTIGYEVDNAQNVVVVKVILPDSGRDTDDARMLELMGALTGF